MKSTGSDLEFLNPRPSSEPAAKSFSIGSPETVHAATSVVATIGPASEPLLGKMIEAGLSVARINFSHGTIEDHRRRVGLIRAEAAKRQAVIGILGDIPGPKLRVSQFEGGGVELVEGAVFKLRRGRGVAEENEMLFDFEGFEVGVEVGHRIFLGDAMIELRVVESSQRGVFGEVIRGGRLFDRQGVHLPDTPIDFKVPTKEDRKFIELANELELDLLGISFVSTPEEVERVRGLAPDMLLVAKIERLAALSNIEGILSSADGLMVARGDLGVEIEIEQLPLVQKSLIQAAMKAGKFSITATQMLESMVSAPRPTRAEVTDVANAVIDGTDAVMLSGETAIGKFPVQAVEMMDNIARAVEASQRIQHVGRTSFRTSEPTFSNAAAMAAVQAAEALGITKILAFTESGNTVRQLSRYRPTAEIIALSPHERTLRRMTILAHVRPVQFERYKSLEEMLDKAQELLIARGLVRRGEEIVFLAGVPPGVSHSTNVVKLHRIGAATRLH